MLYIFFNEAQQLSQSHGFSLLDITIFDSAKLTRFGNEARGVSEEVLALAHESLGRRCGMGW